MKVFVILNPTAGASPFTDQAQEAIQTTTQEEEIKEILQQYHVDPTFLYTSVDESGTGLAKEAAAQEADIVIAAGGDGTIHAVAKGLIGTRATLGIIPRGTMNNLARSLFLPETIKEACEVIVNGRTQRIDAGTINGHLFLEVAGIGLEASLFPMAEEMKRPGILSSIRGAIQGFITLLRFKPEKLYITINNKERSYRAIQVTVCNAPYYGAHLEVAPDAVMDDGLLDVVIYRNFSKREYLQHGLSISRGKRDFQPKIARRRIQSMRILSEQPIDIHADGMPKGQTPALIQVEPAVLRVRVSATAHLNVQQEAKTQTIAST